MTHRKTLFLLSAMLIFAAVVTFPFWGMGLAVFLDSERIVLSRVTSPDGMRVAQVERIIVGGFPSIVVKVRPRWMPDWYIASCAAASHYGNAEAQIHWSTNTTIVVTHVRDLQYWNVGSSPFDSAPCNRLNVTFDTIPI